MKLLAYLIYILQYIAYLFKLAFYYLFKNKKPKSFKKKFLFAFILLIPIVYLFIKNTNTVRADWWPGNGNDWNLRKQLTLQNLSSEDLAADTTISLTFNTKELYDEDSLQADCDDLRIVYVSGSTYTEVTRYIEYPEGTTCSTSEGTKVYFSLEAALSGDGTDSDYYLYYDNPQADTPTSTDNAFDIGSVDSLLTCSLNGTTTCAAGETPSTESGPIRYSQKGSAIRFNEKSDSYLTFPNQTAFPRVYDNKPLTYELWVYPYNGWHGGEAYSYVIGNNDGASTGVIILWNYSSRKPSIEIEYSDTDFKLTSNEAISKDTWSHVAFTFDPNDMNNSNIFINGVKSTYSTQTAGVGTINDDSNTTYTMPGSHYTQKQNNAYFDEVRISDMVRYKDNFTPQTTPFISDEHTKVLLHLDENGSDPRNAGKAIDVSGNDNHGTITNAKYINGIVGITGSTSESGNITSQSFASHQGLFIEEDTTNKITNPSFENSSSYSAGWDTLGTSLTLSEETGLEFIKFGSSAAKIVASGTGDNDLTIGIDPDSTSTHTLSAFVYNGTSGDISEAIDNTVAQLVFEGSAISGTTYEHVGGGWYRLSYSAAATDSTNEYGIYVVDGKTIYLDGVQLEPKTYPTSFAEGDMGTGYSWAGTAHESATTRTDETLQYSKTDNIDTSEGSISLWAKPSVTAGDNAGDLWFFSTGANQYTWNYLSIFTNQYNSDKLTMRIVDSAGETLVTDFTSPIIEKDKWYHIVMTWDGATGTVTGYLNTTSSTNTNPSYNGSDFGSTLEFYDRGDLSSEVTDLRIYDTVLTSAQVTDMYYAGMIAHTESIEVQKFEDDKGQNPIAVWKFDEASDTTTYDSTIFANDLSFSTGDTIPTRATSGCISKSCLSFDGTDDYAYKANDIDFDFSDNSFTLSGWFNHNMTIADTDTIISKYGESGYKLYMDSSGYICFAIDDDNSWTPDDSICSTTDYSDGAWHHFSAVKSSTSTISLYIDGRLIGSDSSLAATSTLSPNGTFYLGTDANTNNWHGYLDEFKIYPYARSSNQIITDTASKGTGGSGVIAQIGNHPQDYLLNGLVAYWKLDEGLWDGTANEVIDYSGNGYHGVGVGTTATAIEAGKFGNAGIFNGSDNYVDLNDAQIIDYTEPFTISYWSYVDSYTNDHSPTIFNIKTNVTNSELAIFYTDTDWIGYDFTGLNIADITIGLRIKTDGDISDDFVGSWKHVVVVYDGNESTKDDVSSYKVYIDGIAQSMVNAASHVWATSDGSYIGSDTAVDDYFDGKLNELRYYNRTFSPKEVRDLYNWAPGPVLYLKMDEGIGSSAYDSSGYGNNGNWNGTGIHYGTGKFGKAGKFNNNDDQVSISSNSSFRPIKSITASAWIYSNGLSNGDCVLNVGNPENSPYSGYYIRYNANAIQSLIGTGSDYKVANSSFSPTTYDKKWNHVSTTYDGSTIKMYVNGILGSTTDSYSGDIYYQDNETFLIGKGNANCLAWNGLIDDVRIYNYARTQKQIIEDMGAGAKTSSTKSPIAYYNFNEGYGSTANNSGFGGSSLNGTLAASTAAPTWSNNSKIGKALDFNSSDSEYVTVGDLGTNIQSVCFWIKLDSTSENIIDFDDGTHYIQASSGTVSAEGFSSPTIYIDGKESTTIDTNWHHVCASTATSFDANAVTIGKVSTNYLDGLIDELKIYSFALTDSEVKLEYNQGKSVVLGSVSTASDGVTPDNSTSRAYCIPGDTATCDSPVAEWQINENTGSTIYDTSGNENNGTLRNTLGTNNKWTKGKIGSSLWQDGTNGGFDFSSPNITDTYTIEYWEKIDGTISYGWHTNSLQYSFQNYGLRFTHFECSNIVLEHNFSGSQQGGFFDNEPNLCDQKWHHIAFSYNGTDTAYLYIDGKFIDDVSLTPADWDTGRTGRFFDFSGSSASGNYDDIKIYDYARTPAQIAWDYNRGKPIFHYKLDECQGTTAYNSARDSNDEAAGTDGTITIGGTGSQTGVGTCADGASTSAWYNGKIGKYSSSLDFDGTDDYISVGDTTREDIYTISFWAKPNSTTESILELTASDSIGISSGTISVTGFGTETIYVDGIESSTLPDTNWHQITIVSDTAIDADAVNFAKVSTTYYQGQLDDIQIFNYELNSTQVKTLYNNGAVSFGD